MKMAGIGDVIGGGSAQDLVVKKDLSEKKYLSRVL